MPDVLGDTPSTDRLVGLTFAKQFPNSAEPLRGLFVLRQVLATSRVVDWRVIAPVPWGPPVLGRLLRRPRVAYEEVRDSLAVVHPAYQVLPRRLAYGSAGSAMARASRPAFEAAVAGGARFVHAHALFPSGDAARRLAAPAKLPLIVTVHGSDLYTMLDCSEWAAMVSDVCSAASVVVCVSEHIAWDVRDRLGVSAEKVVVIPDAYDDSTFHYIERPVAPQKTVRPAAPPSARRPRDGETRLACVGRLEAPKGPDVLIEAMGLLAREGVSAHLTLVGSGSLKRSLRTRAEALDISDNVTLAGALPPDRVVEVLAASDLYVQPSRREGFGVALIEALATGLPAVATRAGGPQDYIDDSNGVLAEPGDPVSLASAIGEGIDRLGTYDAERIASAVRERFSSAVVGERLVRLYYDVLTERRAQ